LTVGRPIQIDIDCADPDGLAAFWAEVLDYRVAPPPTGHESWTDFSRAEAAEEGERWCRVIDPSGSGPSILFHRVPEPKSVKNRLHLDVFVAPPTDPERNWPVVDAEVQRLVGLGAGVVRRVNEDDQCFVVMTDPEGNEFCVCG
jgi:hypothetical protein